MISEEGDGNQTRRMMSLVEISTNKCIQNFNKLQDVGRAPFHLIKPILRRMSAKQLSLIEEQCPQVMPESDSLWPEFIAKEFPGRPDRVNSIQMRQKNGRKSMPNKGLYLKYVEERESFRKDSAERLRNMTEKLKMQKSANSIVAVPQLLKDPTVKKRRDYWGPVSRGGNSRPVNKNSILFKARKDLQSRSLMFPKYSQNVQKYDPFDAFKVLKQENESHHILPPRDHRRNKPAGNFHSTVGRNNNRINFSGPAPPKPSIQRHSEAVKSPPIKSSNDQNPSSVVDPENRGTTSPTRSQIKRPKAEPSIFLNKKRTKVPKPHSQPKGAGKFQDNNDQPAKKVKTIKSSIFN